ncbi:MAG: hypothetical protein MRY83_11845 [Flavobacteriales bacterium]|nr:hypothetical protein [Flavobacteriales bacterium]
MDEKEKISWMALRYSELKENQYTQIGLSFIMGLILVGTIVIKNYLFGSFILIAAFILYYIKKRETPYIPIEIHSKGISINTVITNYDRISAFDIHESEEDNLLIYKLKDTFFGANKVIIIEPEVDRENLKELLSKHIPQKKIKQSPLDKLLNSF